MSAVIEKLYPWRTTWVIERYQVDDPELMHLYCMGHLEPYDTSVIDGNIALNTGKADILGILIGTVTDLYNTTNARIGVGDSSTAEAATQTDLVASSNKAYASMKTGYPQLGTTTTTNDTVLFQAEFGTSVANYSWKEFVMKNNASSVCLNRKVSDQGTKASGQIWTVTCKLQLVSA